MFRFPGRSYLDAVTRRRALEEILVEHFREHRLPVKIGFFQAGNENSRYRVQLKKERGRILIGLDHRRQLAALDAFRLFAARLPSMIRLFARIGPSVVRAVADISDGEDAGHDTISFCARVDVAILVPDCEFYRLDGYAAVRSHAQAGTGAWRDRDDIIVWRGSTTGPGQIAPDDMDASGVGMLPRTRLCLLLRHEPRTDVCFADVVQATDREAVGNRFTAAGILGEALDVMTWRERKFAIDIDGNSNAWSNLFTRLLLGCCVIKVGSKLGFRQWYYDDLRPWEHFVPVAPDMTDLIEKIEWCRTHQQACKEIAASGQQFAMQRTYETEMQSAVERIERRLGSAKV